MSLQKSTVLKGVSYWLQYTNSLFIFPICSQVITTVTVKLYFLYLICTALFGHGDKTYHIPP